MKRGRRKKGRERRDGGRKGKESKGEMGSSEGRVGRKRGAEGRTDPGPNQRKKEKTLKPGHQGQKQQPGKLTSWPGALPQPWKSINL